MAQPLWRIPGLRRSTERPPLEFLRSWIAARAPACAGGPAGAPANGDLEQLLTQVFDRAKDGITLHARDGTILAANATMLSWYGDGRPLVGRKCFEAFHGRSGACERCPLEAAVRSGRPQLGVVPFQLAGKELGQQELSVFPLFDEAGALLCVLQYVRDITGIGRDGQALEHLKRHVQLKDHQLEEQETALAVVLRQVHKLEQRAAEEVAFSIDTLVMPLVARLKARCQDDESHRELALLEQRLAGIASPRSTRLSTALRVLTAREREIALLVRQGRTSKEIGAVLRISIKAVDYHRTHIRRKLGLEKVGGTLQEQLLALEHPSPVPG